MKKILIVDDENRTRSLIANMIQSFGFDVEIVGESDNVQSAINAIQKHQPDIVFLDIQMPDGTGFDVLASIADKNFDVIFITAHEEFAIKAIKFSALDYLLKPIDPFELKAALEKAIQKNTTAQEKKSFDALEKNIQHKEKRRLVLKTQDSVHIVDLDDIIRCEADRNYTSFFLTSGNKIVVSKTLKEYETLLSDFGFIRIQQSHLINIKHTDRYEKKGNSVVIMKDGSKVPLSPAKKDLFFKKLENL